jgi:hypothetical protein
MAVGNADKAGEPRIPTIDDLVLLCRSLNDFGAKYIVIGGWAVIQHGFGRTTGDIDLLVEGSTENFLKIKEAMSRLPDAAIRDVEPDDLARYIVVRVADEFVVDLMRAACGVEYAEAREGISPVMIQNVNIPFASPRLLLRLKRTYREKDAQDVLFLTTLLEREGRH